MFQELSKMTQLAHSLSIWSSLCESSPHINNAYVHVTLKDLSFATDCFSVSVRYCCSLGATKCHMKFLAFKLLKIKCVTAHWPAAGSEISWMAPYVYLIVKEKKEKLFSCLTSMFNVVLSNFEMTCLCERRSKKRKEIWNVIAFAILLLGTYRWIQFSLVIMYTLFTVHQLLSIYINA